MPYIDFKEIKSRVSIEDAATMLNLDLKKSANQLRGACPACGGDERTLAITPARNLFYCFSAKKGGDQIELVSHITGLEVKEAAEYLAPHSREEPHRSPAPTQREEKHKEKSAPFDPAKFAAKLVYSDEVEALGITEDDATRLGVGWHPQRKAIYFPQKDDTGFVSGFIAFKDGKLVMPPKWLHQDKVVKLRRA